MQNRAESAELRIVIPRQGPTHPISSTLPACLSDLWHLLADDLFSCDPDT